MTTLAAFVFAAALGQTLDTFIVLPDTQNYVNSGSDDTCNNPQVFDAQMAWVAAQTDVAAWLHVGDIVSHPDRVEEWECAETSLGLAMGLPHALALGNHDSCDLYLPCDPPLVNSELYNERFPSETTSPWYADHLGTTNDNHAITFELAGEPWVAVAAEFMLTQDPAVIQWVHDTFAAHADRRGIFVTHSMLHENGGWDGTRGEDLFNAVSDIPNLELIVCGHRFGEQTRTRIVEGRRIHILMANYQHFAFGGEGWLRIYRLTSEGRRLHVETYSPWLDQTGSVFDLNIGTPGDVNVDGSVGIDDFLGVLGAWGAPGFTDIDGDGFTGITDFLLVLSNWGPTK